MEENRIVVQKWKKDIPDDVNLAIYYYSLLFSFNKLNVTEREIQMVAFAAVKGNISYAEIREEFCKIYSSSNPTINNMVSKLKKMKVLIKDNGKIKVNPSICPKFGTADSIILQITLTNEEFRKQANSNDSSRVDNKAIGHEVFSTS